MLLLLLGAISLIRELQWKSIRYGGLLADLILLISANNYQDDESELWIGEWMKERGNRDEMVIATKFTSSEFLVPRFGCNHLLTPHV